MSPRDWIGVRESRALVPLLARPPFRGSPREAPFLAQQVGFSSLPSDSVRQNTRNSNKVPISGFD
jgi:hypothetical protein